MAFQHSTFSDSRQIPPGMLSSPHIALYVSENLLIDNYDPSCLGSCSYNMRMGGTVLFCENKKKCEITLVRKEDYDVFFRESIKKEIDLKPNSLTFITTIEKFNLPRDVIARYNLKSKWIHKGLLLGTGPIVDPQIHTNLLIPLHNFSSNYVRIAYGDEIISVEFTKTLNPDDICVTSHKCVEYIDNRSKDLNFDKYISRLGELPESSVSSTLANEEGERQKFKKEFSLFKYASLLGIIGLSVTLYTMFSNATQYSNSANNLSVETKEKLQNLSDKVSSKEEFFKNEIGKLQLQIEKDIHDRDVEIFLLKQALEDIKNRNSSRTVPNK